MVPEKEEGQQKSCKENGRHHRDFPLSQIRESQKKAGEGNGQVQKAARIKGADADFRRLAHRQAACHKGNQKQRKHRPEYHAPAEKAHNRRCQGAHQHACPHHDTQPVKRCLLHNDIKHEGQGDARTGPLEKPSQKEKKEIRRPGAKKRSQNEKPCRR